MKEIKQRYYLISGLFAVISLLTTPRIGIIFIASGLALLLSLEGKPLKHALLILAWWLLPVVILYLSWTYYAFGGITEMYHYYIGLKAAFGEYVGGRWYIPRHEYPLVCLTAISVVYGIITRRLNYFTTGVIISLLSIPLFYIVVLDWGPYSVLILPFYYFLFFQGFNNPEFSWKSISLYPVLILVIFNVSYFTLKSAQIISEQSIREPEVATAFVKKHIPPGSKVIGDPQYYYAVVKSGSDFRLYESYLTAELREKILREVYDYDYFILSDRYLAKDPLLAEHFFRSTTLKKVAELKLVQPSLSKKISDLGVVSSSESYGYNAQIFVRIKEEKTWVGMLDK